MLVAVLVPIDTRSLPARGVWVEIPICCMICRRRSESLPARGVWVEIVSWRNTYRKFESLPARGVWVEIATYPLDITHVPVTPREGSVG